MARRMTREEVIAKMRVSGVCMSCRYCDEIIHAFTDSDSTIALVGELNRTRVTKEHGWQWQERITNEWLTYYDCLKNCPYELERMMDAQA